MKTRKERKRFAREDTMEYVVVVGVALELSLPFIVLLMHL